MIKHWTEDEEQQLLDLKSQGMKLRDIAIKLNRSYESVKTRSKRLMAQMGEKAKNGNFSWKPEEIELLYDDLDYDELAQLVNRSRRSIQSKCEKLGIPKRFNGGFKYGTMNPDKPTTLYLVDFGDFKKVGVTQLSIQERFNGYPEYNILDMIIMTLDDALDTEAEILRNMRPYKVRGNIRRGYTECFNFDCTEFEDLL